MRRSSELREWSRNGELKDFENLRKMCGFYHELRKVRYEEPLNQISAVFANVLLKNEQFRALTLTEKLPLVQDVEQRLQKDSEEDGFQVEWEIPLWRILFLLAHKQSAENAGNSIFDRSLAPHKFQHLTSKLAQSGSSNHAFPLVFEELGKFWYALCYNYGALRVRYGAQFWQSLESFNISLRANEGKLLDKFESPLLQICSLLLLSPEADVPSTFTMVVNLMAIFKRAVDAWSFEVSKELYSSLHDYKIPQVIHIIHVFVLKSSPTLRRRIRRCFGGEYGCVMDLRTQVLAVECSTITCSSTRDALHEILELLGLTLNPSDTGALEIIPSFRSQPPAGSDESVDTVFDPRATQQSSLVSDVSSSSATLQSYFSGEAEAPWSEEDRIAEAERIMAAIRRLDELGIIKTTLPGS